MALKILREEQGAGLLIIVLILLSLSLMVGTLPMNMALVLDERATDNAQASMRKIALAISSTTFNAPPKNIRHYEQDVGALPTLLNDLLSKPVAVGTCFLSTSTHSLSGWCGPYLEEKFSGETPFFDGWGSALILNTLGRSVRSAGPNRTDDSGASDDLVQSF